MVNLIYEKEKLQKKKSFQKIEKLIIINTLTIFKKAKWNYLECFLYYFIRLHNSFI